MADRKITSITDAKETTGVQSFSPLIQTLAQRFSVPTDEFVATVKMQCFPDGAASNAQLMMLCSFAQQYDLNLLAKECYAFLSGGRMSVGVQVDGWTKIANRQDNYDGQDIDYEYGKDGELIAIKSTTHVKGRSRPTIYRAVLKEWQRNTDVWKAMPTHQLYVKARNEGIRFAFGISAYDPDDLERMDRQTVDTTAHRLKITTDSPEPDEADNETTHIKTIAAPIEEDAAEDLTATGQTDPPLESLPNVNAVREVQQRSIDSTDILDDIVVTNESGEGERETEGARAQWPTLWDQSVRGRLYHFFEQRVPDARQKLLLAAKAVRTKEELTDEQCEQLLKQLEKRGK